MRHSMLVKMVAHRFGKAEVRGQYPSVDPNGSLAQRITATPYEGEDSRFESGRGHRAVGGDASV